MAIDVATMALDFAFVRAYRSHGTAYRRISNIGITILRPWTLLAT